ncbi:MAG: ribose-5-phosphate isomerase RpiA [Planctomycetia bacterium]|nr:ribose-5-phosphate isomerase RpiA [Planctomycetia bacterium]
MFERALEFVTDGTVVGLGSGRASHRFVELLGAQVREGRKIAGVPTSQATADLAKKVGIPLVELERGVELALTIDGADEVDPQLNLIKGYGRALVREKIVAAASKQLVILVGQEKLVSAIGSRGRLPIEVVPFAVPLVLDRLQALGAPGTVATVDGRSLVSDNGNTIVDCAIAACKLGGSNDPAAWELALQAIPGVVGTGLFLNAAAVVLVGDDRTFVLGEELRRPKSLVSKGTP